MYNRKVKDPGSKLDLSEINKEYGKAFKETLEGWGGARIPKRTLEKLQGLAGDIIKNAGDRSLSLIFKGIDKDRGQTKNKHTDSNLLTFFPVSDKNSSRGNIL